MEDHGVPQEKKEMKSQSKWAKIGENIAKQNSTCLYWLEFLSSFTYILYLTNVTNDLAAISKVLTL